ncbi:hypothetical protein BN1708_014910 [Verticillium longisporum]|uniref:Ima1 N-terminal domain-containing protein n=1 Tax=Verticillium longisporum TaxID=100787 RepID=A0A0G4M062_VERLO|nr:hypothetical protein BN1708_014910 [Verticillium longisporum]
MVLRTPSAIASLRSRGNLTCFYCGKRSSVKFNGIISDFLCLKCDATNYLDELLKNGEITDPPVASTTSTTQPTQYAIPRSQSPEPAAQAPSIFCSTCLKNQHLFTASLAQYLPEDPDHPEYAQLEKNYYKFRQRLEERYPQICADCEPKVLAQVQQAGYTARTDHLRRMMERSRQRRASPKRWTALDMADTLGRWFWFAGLTGQLLWHFATMADALSTMTTGPLRDTDELSPAWTSVLRWMANALPQSSVLVRMSFWANLLCIWWNPKFTQVFRGFSKHIHGLSQWYVFQGLVLLVRFLGVRIAGLAGAGEGRTSAQISLHALLAIVVVVLYALAQKSVHVDTTPLFPSSSTPLALSPARPRDIGLGTETGAKSLSNLLDDILHETPKAPMVIPTRPSPSPKGPISPNPELQSISGISSLGLSTAAAPVQYSEEMEWSPTQSRHRAFNDFGAPGRQSQAFGDSPTNPSASPFWYKVPPAPTTPAERLRKASNPILRSKPVGPEAVFFPTNSQPLNTGARLSDSNKSKRKVSFAQPSFFASPKSNPSDPRSTLADMLGSSFNLSQDGDSDQDNANRESPDIELKMIRPLRNPAARDRFIDIFTLGSLIASWLHVTSASYTYTWDVMLGSMALSVAVALHLTSDAFYGLRIGQIPRQLAMANSILGVAEVAAACILSFQVWVTPRGDEHEAFGVQGLVVMSLMLCHGLVNMAV